MPSHTPSIPLFRIGQGVDVHAFARGRRLVLGGVEIACERGLEGHSDADVVIHALCDALLGAAALGDIGVHFPSNDPQWKNVDSRILLRRVRQLLEEQKWTLANADITILAQSPRLAPHIPEMQKRLAEDLGVRSGQISIKATTPERLGALGREEGIAVWAVALICGRPGGE